MEAEEYYNKIRRQLGTQALLSYQIDGCRLYGKDAICKMLEDYHQEQLKLLNIPVVSVNEEREVVSGWCKGEGWIDYDMTTGPCKACGGKQTER
jgi:hypothetical protein